MHASKTMQQAMETFVRAVPVPKSMAFPAAGVDISDSSVRLLVLEGLPGELRVAAAKTTYLPTEVVVRGEVRKPEVLGQVISDLARKIDITYAHVSLPEEHAYLFETPIPVTEDTNVEEAIEFTLKENVPLAPEEVVFDYLIAGTSADGTEALLAVSAYPRRVLMGYLEALHRGGLIPLSLETEGHAIARAVLDKEAQNETVLVLDLGRHTTGFSVVRKGVILFSAQLEVTGSLVVSALARAGTLSPSEAEALLYNNRFLVLAGRDAERRAVVEVLRQLCGEIEKHIAYWNMHAHPAHGQESIRRMIAVGTLAAVPGLLEHLRACLSIPLARANVWQNVNTLETYLPPISRARSLSYATAIGLALATYLP